MTKLDTTNYNIDQFIQLCMWLIIETISVIFSSINAKATTWQSPRITKAKKSDKLIENKPRWL